MAAGIERRTTAGGSTARRCAIILSSIWLAAGAAACGAGILAAAGPALGLELITPAEAALPPAPPPSFELRGSPTRRPHVTVLSPPAVGLVHSPVELKLRYSAFGGAGINPDTVVITYLKNPAIDITQRIKPFITADGIDIKQADVPPGLHQFWIELRDNDGRIAGAEFSFQVAK